NIEDIEVGDQVLAKDESDPEGDLGYKEVTALYRNQRDDIIKLHVGEQVIETTDNHPFWVEGKGWIFADELQVGDKLQKADGSNLKIDKVEFLKLDKPITVYNFTVADYHTYYVTDIGIWVHNTDCFSGFSRFDEHFDKHVLGRNGGRREYGDDFTKQDYYDLAYDLATKRVDGVNIIQRYQGNTKVIYNKRTNDMVFIHRDGTIGSLYKPKYGSRDSNAGYNYFMRITTQNP
uniref:polymorphic toxin-type HINT domain-containing protein n=1 Tax=Paenibacillus massiliensis TaxID=225917 RepID=UPI00035C38E8